MQYPLFYNKVTYSFKEVIMFKIRTVVPFSMTSDIRASPEISLYLCCSQVY